MDNSFLVHLPNGQTAQLLTRTGADTFLDFMGKDFIQKNLPAMIQAQKDLEQGPRRKRREQTSMLKNQYILFAVLCEHATPAKFEGCLPEADVCALVRHYATVLTGTVMHIPQWKDQGTLPDPYADLVHTLSTLCRSPAFIEAFWSEGGFAGLAQLYAVPDKKLDLMLVENVVGLCSNVVLNGKESRPGGGVGFNTALRRLHTSGLLVQALRVYKFVPFRSPPQSLGLFVHFLQDLQTSKLMASKIHADTPLGKQVLELAKLSSLPPELKTKLQTMAAMSGAMQGSNQAVGNAMCRTCGKSEAQVNALGRKILHCSRCKAAPYCSKECQVADWKAHKKLCKVIVKAEKQNPVTDRELEAGQNLILNFVKSNYTDICDKIHQYCRTHKGVTKADLVLEMDYFRDAPALQGQFKIGLTKNYLEGTRPEEPDWFFKGTSVYESNINYFCMAVQDQAKRLTPNHLLAICRSSDGTSGAFRLSMLVPETGHEMFSDQAMNAVARMDEDALQRIFGPSRGQAILHSQKQKYMSMVQGLVNSFEQGEGGLGL